MNETSTKELILDPKRYETILPYDPIGGMGLIGICEKYNNDENNVWIYRRNMDLMSALAHCIMKDIERTDDYVLRASDLYDHLTTAFAIGLYANKKQKPWWKIL
jgi:hypothetical protein